MNYKTKISVVLSLLSAGYFFYAQLSPQSYTLADGVIVISPISYKEKMRIDDSVALKFPSTGDSVALKFPSTGDSVSLKLKRSTTDSQHYHLICIHNKNPIDCSSLRFFCEDERGYKIACETAPLASWRLAQ